MKIIKKYRVFIIILIIVVMIVSVALAFKAFLYPSDSKSLYGGRLNEIENVKIDTNKEMSVINEIKAFDEVRKSSMHIQGKIINIIIRGEEGLTVDRGKELSDNSLKKFSKEEKKFYDFQFFITGDKYTLIGYKNSKTENIVWTEVSEVDDNENKAE